MSTSIESKQVLRSEYQRSIAAYWNVEKAPVNLRLGDVDGLYHHHYGIGAVDTAALEGPEEGRDERIIKELHRLETAQADLLLDSLGPVGPEDYLLDAGCGRGGTSVMANQRFGCFVDGISISEQQVAFANARAAERKITDKVKYHFRNMLDTKFPSAMRRAIWNNESTMYVDLNELFAEHARQLVPGGRYVTITGCYNDVLGGRTRARQHVRDPQQVAGRDRRTDVALAVAG